MIGSIGVISGELGRYVDFYASLAQVAMPEGTQMIWSKGTSIPENCNGCIRRAQDWASAVDGPREDDWVWILGDDHMMPADSLVRLLAHDVDIVAPLGLRRRPPVRPRYLPTRRGQRAGSVREPPDARAGRGSGGWQRRNAGASTRVGRHDRPVVRNFR